MFWFVIVFGLLAVEYYRRRFLTVSAQPTEIHLPGAVQKVERSAEVVLYRYRPHGARYRYPLVMWPGLGANEMSFDLGSQISFARAAAEFGFDVFVVSPSATLRRPVSAAFRSRNFRSRDFRSIVESEVPAVLDAVRDLSGSQRVLWMGHSFGGLIAYALMVGPIKDRLQAVVTLGSSSTFDHLSDPWQGVLRRFPEISIPLRWLARRGAPYLCWLPLPFPLVNRNNFIERDLGILLYNVVGDIAAGEVNSVKHWVESGGLGATGFDVHNELATATTPILMIAGTRDCVAPPAAVKRTFDTLGAKDKQLIMAGRAGDYGHLDLVMSRNAMREIVPDILSWLAERASGGTSEIKSQRQEIPNSKNKTAKKKVAKKKVAKEKVVKKSTAKKKAANKSTSGKARRKKTAKGQAKKRVKSKKSAN